MGWKEIALDLHDLCFLLREQGLRVYDFSLQK